MSRHAWAVLAVTLTALLANAAFGQSDAALRDRVGLLVERLEAPKVEARDAAEESLLKLGPRVLPLLPQADRIKNDDLKKRLDRIRDRLREAASQVNLGPTLVTLEGKGIRLSEAIQRLQSQSGNPITDLRDFGGGGENPSLNLEIKDRPFLEALDIVCKQAQITPNYYTGDGTIGLMEGGPSGSSAPVVYSGPFRIEFRQIGALRDLATGMSSANAQFEVAWEPRLRPMLLALKPDALKVTDDQGKDVEAQVSDESTDTVLRPDSPVAEINLNLKSPDRSAKALKSVKVRAEVTVPSGLQTFSFANIDVKKPETIKKGEIALILGGTELDEHVWKVNVELAYPGEGPAFESYRQGLFNNRLWLQKADGSRFEHNGGFSNTSADEGRLGFEYLFVDAPGKPGDYGLVYETPSEVKPIPLEFEFNDVPLP